MSITREELQAARRLLGGLTQRQFADMLGIDVGTLSKYEAVGARHQTPPAIARTAVVLLLEKHGKTL